MHMIKIYDVKNVWLFNHLKYFKEKFILLPVYPLRK